MAPNLKFSAERSDSRKYVCVRRLETGKRVLKFRANFSEVFKALSLNNGPNFIQIRLLVSYTVMHVDQLLRDKPLKTAFGSTEKN